MNTSADRSGNLRPTWATGLSARLLVLTILFVMFVEALVLVPSIGKNWRDFLNERLEAAHLAVLARDATPDGMVDMEIERDLLEIAGVRGVALKYRDRRELVLSDRQPLAIDARYNLMEATILERIMHAFGTLARAGDGQIQVVGQAQRMPGEFIEIVLDEGELFASVMRFIRNVLLLSLVISVVTAALVYFALHRIIVRPMKHITADMAKFRAAPDNPGNVVDPWRRADEIGVAQREIARMQSEVHRALDERARLANLGAAVARINHDLRNILSGLQLASDSLARFDDSRVNALAKRLMRSVDRGIRLCEHTLAYGRASEPEPVIRVIRLGPIVDEIGLLLGLGGNQGVRLDSRVNPALEVCADSDQLYRILLNLIRNAIEAMAGRGTVTVSAMEEADRTIVRVADNGPGVPERLRDDLFKPFARSRKKGGAGLGLAIAAELVRGHGQSIWLEKSDPSGAVFAFSLLPPQTA